MHHGAQANNAAAQKAGAGVQFGPVGRWWDDKSVVSAVGLSSEQKRHMDAIFAQNRPAIVSSYQNLLKEQAKLSALNKSPQADQTSTFAAIDAVNQARASLQKTVAQVYMQIKQQMSSDQIEKLTKMQ
jgi:Spy/CpxP family protein refolding chaperone